jgi:hypothetical protein
MRDGPGREGPESEIAVAPGVVISDTLCVYLEGPGAVIVSDIHLGMEAAAQAEGAFFPRRQKPVILKRLKRIVDRFRPELFVINGDFKHNFGRDMRREMDEVAQVHDYLDSKTDVVLTRGNHDNFMRSILPDVQLPDKAHVGSGFVCHGHRALPALERFKGLKVLGHEHPALKLQDSVGARVSAPAFVFDERSLTLVLPALSPLAAGTDILRNVPRSPFLRMLDRRRFRLFAVSEQGILDFGRAGELEAALE